MLGALAFTATKPLRCTKQTLPALRRWICILYRSVTIICLTVWAGTFFFFLIKHKVLVIDRVDHRYRGRYISNAEQFHYCCCIPTEKCFSVILPAGSYEDVTCGKITLFYEPGLENSTGSRYNHTHDH
jgi:hypothetical protein